ncbi:hypothetical protein SKDZ_15G4820 [Saccharomyces kudriavzevii ZP591]|uniref:Mne1p n=1 Tax=Saccharomyces cerevisiae x Saccharomyces kudriavzevii (strain VIN7) TaxID=1095631 RepID=H0H1L4_SACCK|nr:Mne1p [Saccharomyces cerevisiae x Saccharomyces kudriavzevii VIN7]CAI4052369.1 hypothetical protein SKDZ_15G4820 [Saccharomyces kudriavzevii ZP591]
MKFIFRRCSSTHIGKLIKESLNTPELLSPQLERRSPLYQRSPNVKRTNSITDKWLKDALTRKDKLKEGKLRNVNLRLSVVLTTLQKLRTAYNPALYFALLNRVGTGHIIWLNKMGRPIATLPYGRLPLEFFHELSNMLYNLSLRPVNDKIALAKFSLQLLDHYYFLKAKSFTGKEEFQSNPKFLRNCAFLVAKSQSNYYLKVMQGLFTENFEGQLLIKLSQLAFYVETSQWTSVVESLPSCIFDFTVTNPKKRDRDIQILELFRPCFIKTLEILIAQDMEGEACHMLTSLYSNWNLHLDPHDSSNLVQLCENHSCLKVIEILNKLSLASTNIKQFGLEKLPFEIDLKECMHFLSKRNFQPFKQEAFLQSLSFKLGDLPSSLGVWRRYINEMDEQMQAECMPLPLKALFINILLAHLSLYKNFNFVLSLVEHIVYERELWKPFLLTKNIIGNKENSGIHCFFHAMSQATCTKVALLTLFNQLNRMDYQFSVHDFLSMLKVCKTYSDCDFFYFVYYNFLIAHSHKFLQYDKFNGKFSWRLPTQIGDAISAWLSSLEIDIRENTDRVLQITDDVSESYVDVKSIDLEGHTVQPIDKLKLRRIFGERKTLFDMDSDVFQDCRAKRDKEVGMQACFTANDARYDLVLDLSYSKRIEDLLSYIISRQTQQKE